jgi:hypothetical protein
LWIAESLHYFGITAAKLEEELSSLDISRSLFDVVVWAYCEHCVKRLVAFKDYFDRLLAASNC